MPIDFPIGTKVIALGRVAEPVIPILIQTRNGYVPFDFLVFTLTFDNRRHRIRFTKLAS